MKNIILIFGLLFAFVSKAQFREYLVNIDPATANFSRIDSLPGIKLIRFGPPVYAIDKINNRYYFTGVTSLAGVEYLFSANMTTGKLRNHGVWNVQQNGLKTIGHYQFDDSTGYIYGMGLNSTNNPTLFKMDTANAQVTAIKSYTNLTGGVANHCQTYDQKNHRYIFLGTNSGQTNVMITVDVLTGNMISAPPITTNDFPWFLRYNNATSTLYALFSSGKGTVALASVNAQNAQPINTLTTITNVTLVTTAFQTNRVSLDEVNNRITYIETKSNPKLLTIDLSTGNILHSPTFTTNLLPGENIIEIGYHNGTGNLHALHWGDQSSGGVTTSINSKLKEPQATIVVAPNPGISSLTIQISDPTKVNRLSVYDELGRRVFNLKKENLTNQITIPSLAPGIYFVEAETNFGIEKMRALVTE